MVCNKFIPLLSLLLCGITAFAAQKIMVDGCDAPKNWTFSNGAEFPGAKGGLRKDTTTGKIELWFDFTSGGKYVSASLKTVLPHGAQKFQLRLRGDGKSRVEYRIVDASGRTFHGFPQKLSDKSAEYIFPCNNSWVAVWGGEGLHNQPKQPFCSFSLLLYGGEVKTGSIIIESCELWYNTLPKSSFKGEDFTFDGSGWNIVGKWEESAAGPQLKLTASQIAEASNAEIAVDFPDMARDRITRYPLAASEKQATFRYKPFAASSSNPNNSYRITVSLHGNNGSFSGKDVRLIGDNAHKINFGTPVNSQNIKESTVGTCTHFAYAPKDEGPFRGWHNYRDLLDMISAAGIKWIRDVCRAEKGADGKYHVAEHDMGWIKYAREKGINIIVLLWLDPKTDIEEEKRHTEAIVVETKPYVQVYEIGNEPENFGWKPKYGGTWNGYEGNGKLNRWVHEFLKYSNALTDHIKKVRPEAVTIGLGATPPTNFHLLNLGVTKNLDGIVEHPYTFSLPPEKIPFGWSMEKRDGIRVGDQNNAFAGLINSYIEHFNKTGKMRSIWVTEFGYSTFLFNGKTENKLYGAFSEEAQAVYLLRRFIQSMTLPIKVSCQYDFIDDYDSSPFMDEANFGVIRADHSKKPSYHAIQRMNSLFNGYSHDKTLSVKIEKDPLHRSAARGELVKNWDTASIKADNGIMAFGFSLPENPGEKMLAVWSVLPYSGEFSNRACTFRIIGGKEYSGSPVAIDLITGRSFDIPMRIDGNDLVFENLILKNHPLVIKLLKL